MRPNPVRPTMPSTRGLSLSSTDWKHLSEALEGSAWQSTWLDPIWSTSVPEEAGVYILHTFPKFLSETYTLPREVSGTLYVGISNNLRQRFRRHSTPHHENDRIRKFGFIFGRIRFSYTQVPSAIKQSVEDWLANAEHTLVIALDPPANRVVPAGKQMIGKLGKAVPAA
ncbi:MAG: GIY-YIG nuclease family protein [Gemmatimonadetes bacterium]|nr:GIY-YIG nuclease family protein [Gemmatimonadota bacterium]